MVDKKSPFKFERALIFVSMFILLSSEHHLLDYCCTIDFNFIKIDSINYIITELVSTIPCRVSCSMVI